MFLWFLYPIAWGLCEGGNLISPDSEAIFYGILDLLAKPVFGALLIWGHRGIDPARLGSKFYSIASLFALALTGNQFTSVIMKTTHPSTAGSTTEKRAAITLLRQVTMASTMDTQFKRPGPNHDWSSELELQYVNVTPGQGLSLHS